MDVLYIDLGSDLYHPVVKNFRRKYTTKRKEKEMNNFGREADKSNPPQSNDQAHPTENPTKARDSELKPTQPQLLNSNQLNKPGMAAAGPQNSKWCK